MKLDRSDARNFALVFLVVLLAVLLTATFAGCDRQAEARPTVPEDQALLLDPLLDRPPHLPEDRAYPWQVIARVDLRLVAPGGETVHLYRGGTQQTGDVVRVREYAQACSLIDRGYAWVYEVWK